MLPCPPCAALPHPTSPAPPRTAHHPTHPCTAHHPTHPCTAHHPTHLPHSGQPGSKSPLQPQQQLMPATSTSSFPSAPMQRSMSRVLPGWLGSSFRFREPGFPLPHTESDDSLMARQQGGLGGPGRGGGGGSNGGGLLQPDRAAGIVASCSSSSSGATPMCTGKEEEGEKEEEEGEEEEEGGSCATKVFQLKGIQLQVSPGLGLGSSLMLMLRSEVQSV